MRVSAIAALFLATAPFQGAFAYYEQARVKKAVSFSFANRRFSGKE
jgi:hypothetical protein